MKTWVLLLLVVSGIQLAHGAEANPGDASDGGKQCSITDSAAPYLVAVVVARTGSWEHLRASLESVADSVQALLVVPEERSDGPYPSQTVLQGLPGAGKLLKHSITWNRSLSEARNQAMEVAQKSGATWVLLMDDSEAFKWDATGAAPDALKALLASKEQAVLHCYVEDSKPTTKPRFLKLPAVGLWQGPLGEVLATMGLAAPAKQQLLSGLTFASHKNLDRKALLLQNRRLLQRQIATGSFAARDVCMMGATLRQLEEHLPSAAAYRECASLIAAPADAAGALYDAALSFDAGGSRDLAQDMLRQALLKQPGMPQVPWLLSWYAYQEEQYEEAVNWATMATALGCYKGVCTARKGRVSTELQAWFTGPFDVLRFAYKTLGKDTLAKQAQKDFEAAQAAMQALKREPEMGLYQVPLADWVVYPKPPGLDTHEAQPLGQQLEFPQGRKPKVAVAFVTAHRPALFHKTYNSFRQHCLDCNRMVDAWFVADDFSSPEALADMKKTAPPCVVTYLNKSESRRGHIWTMNTIMDAVEGFDYLVNIEDDWFFKYDEEFITAAIDIMNADPQIGQVLFNKDYQEMGIPTEDRILTATLEGGVSPLGRRYFIQTRIAPLNTPEWKTWISKQLGKISNFHWPHFSFNSGVWRLSAIREVGKFDHTIGGYAWPEYDFAKRYMAKGFKTAFLPRHNCVHLAPSFILREGTYGDLDECDRLYAKHGLRRVKAASSRSAYVITKVMK